MENTGRPDAVLTARAAGLIACTTCSKVHPAATPRCQRCGATLQSRDMRSLQRVWAWWLAGLILYIPANIYPILKTSSLGKETDNTIVGGVIELVSRHAYGVALIVFAASVIVPVGKFIAIAFLALSIRRGSRLSASARLHLYEVVEFIGRWSMLDVFVVAILSALVQFKFVANIHPGIAAASFALSVAFTMLSAQSFDPRLIWDAQEGEQS